MKKIILKIYGTQERAREAFMKEPKEVLSVYPLLDIKLSRPNYTVILPDCEIRYVVANKPEDRVKFMGLNIHEAVFEEGVKFPEEVLKEVQVRLGRNRNISQNS